MKPIESSEQAVLEIREQFEEPVVRSSFSGLLPDVISDIELRRVPGQEVDCDKVPDFLQPFSNRFRVVPESVVHDQMDLSSLVVSEQLFDEGQE